MDKIRRRRSSGPRTFSRDQAVDIAMRLFRRHGYEGVSIADLTGAIGIAPPSLYAAFGSKAGLYREALDRFAGLPGALDGMKGATSVGAAVEGLLDAAILAVVKDERGCMITTGLIEGGDQHQDLVSELVGRRQELRRATAIELERWLPKPEADRLAAYLLAVQQGIAIQARDGASIADLQHIKSEAVRGLAARLASS